MEREMTINDIRYSGTFTGAFTDNEGRTVSARFTMDQGRMTEMQFSDLRTINAVLNSVADKPLEVASVGQGKEDAI